MELTTIIGIPIIIIAIPENFPIIARASVWSKPAVIRHLGTTRVDNVLNILLKNPFKVSGKQIISTLNSNWDLLSVFS